MDLLAIWLGKLVLAGLRLIGRRGNALPGLVVEKIFPRFLPRMMTRLPEGVVVVSGTNGKTTTTKMVATLLGENYRVLTNDTGSNFVRGVITATVDAASWRGRLPYDVGVFELDEAWAVRFVAVVAPRRALLLNVMRDQLDRFGEIDMTAQLLGRVASATTGHLVLNRDDQRIAALAKGAPAQVAWYGVAEDLRPRFPNDEELYGGEVTVSTQRADAELVALPTEADPQTTFRLADSTHRVLLRTDGAHNAQNAAGAAALAQTFGLSADQIVAGLHKVQPAFGRGQSFDVNGRRVVLHLVKNPAGFRQSLAVLNDMARPAAIMIAINDDYADGRDVSWLWDVDFTGLSNRADRLLTSGTRAADMAVRLRYDEITADGVDEDLERALDTLVAEAAERHTIVVFSTYTAMWALHGALTRIGVPA